MATRHRIRQVELVGRKIRQLRKQRKLTQTDLAGRIGIHQSDLSRMEKGEYRVSLDTLFRILAEFELSMGEFFDEVNREAVTPRDAQILRRIKAPLMAEQRRQHQPCFDVAWAAGEEALKDPRRLFPMTT